MIRIRLPDTTIATLQNHRWSCADTRLESLLNAMRAPWGSNCPGADLQEAHIVSSVLGAEIIESAHT